MKSRSAYSHTQAGSPTLPTLWPNHCPDLGMSLSLSKLDFEVKSLRGWLLLPLHRCFLLVGQFAIHVLGGETDDEAQLSHEGAQGDYAWTGGGTRAPEGGRSAGGTSLWFAGSLRPSPELPPHASGPPGPVRPPCPAAPAAPVPSLEHSPAAHRSSHSSLPGRPQGSRAKERQSQGGRSGWGHSPQPAQRSGVMPVPLSASAFQIPSIRVVSQGSILLPSPPRSLSILALSPLDSGSCLLAFPPSPQHPEQRPPALQGGNREKGCQKVPGKRQHQPQRRGVPWARAWAPLTCSLSSSMVLSA